MHTLSEGHLMHSLLGLFVVHGAPLSHYILVTACQSVSPAKIRSALLVDPSFAKGHALRAQIRIRLRAVKIGC